MAKENVLNKKGKNFANLSYPRFVRIHWDVKSIKKKTRIGINGVGISKTYACGSAKGWMRMLL